MVLGTSGLVGPTGPKGATGATGAAGTAGPTGATGPSTINYTCNSTCTQRLLQVLVTSGSGSSATSQNKNAATSNLTGLVGIASASVTSGQTVPVSVYGTASCLFDTAVTLGDYVQASSGNGGFCGDAGSAYPSSNQIVGIALSGSNPGSTGTTQTVFLFGAEVHGSAGGATGATGPTGPTGSTGVQGIQGSNAPRARPVQPARRAPLPPRLLSGILNSATATMRARHFTLIRCWKSATTEPPAYLSAAATLLLHRSPAR